MGKGRAYPMFVLAAGLLALPGCLTSGPRNFENDNDRLREQNMALRESVDELQAALDRREAELATLREQLDGAQPLPGVAAPVLTTVEMGRYTGPVDTDGDGLDDVVRLYLRTRDQHGRALPVEGSAKVKLVRLGDEAQEPVTLVAESFDADRLRGRYRSGFTGTHYSFELPLDAAPAGASSLAVRVSVTDAATGVSHEASTAFTVTR